MDSWGTGHRKEVEKPKTKKEKQVATGREALAVSLRLREQHDHVNALLGQCDLREWLRVAADLLEQIGRSLTS